MSLSSRQFLKFLFELSRSNLRGKCINLLERKRFFRLKPFYIDMTIFSKTYLLKYERSVRRVLHEKYRKFLSIYCPIKGTRRFVFLKRYIFGTLSKNKRRRKTYRVFIASYLYKLQKGFADPEHFSH